MAGPVSAIHDTALVRRGLAAPRERYGRVHQAVRPHSVGVLRAGRWRPATARKKPETLATHL